MTWTKEEQRVVTHRHSFPIMVNQRKSVGGWNVEITAPDGERLKLEASLVELCTVDGQIGVMPGHEQLVTVLDVGELVIHNGKQRDVYLLGGGFARAQPERLSVLAFSIELASNGGALDKCRSRRQELLGDE